MNILSKFRFVFFFSFIGLNAIAQYPTDSLFAYYSFDEVEIRDEGPNQYNGVAFDTYFLETSGRKNGSHEFNGNSSYVELFSENFETFSINIWFKTFEETKSQRLFHKGDRGGSANYPLSYSGVFFNEKFRFSIANFSGTGALSLFTDTIPNHDEWHMITCVFNNETLFGKVYLDAVLQDSGYADNAMIPTNDPVRLSYYPLSSDIQVVNGELDELGFWTKELNQDEIDLLYGISSCDNTVEVFDTIVYFVSSPEFEMLSPQVAYLGVDSLKSIQGCDSVVHKHNLFEYNASFCSDTLIVYDTLIFVDTSHISVEDTLNIYLNVTDIEQNEVVNEIRVYPNPASEILTIDYGNYSMMSNYKIELTDAVGSVVWSENVNSQQSIIDILIFERGLYFLKVTDPDGEEVTIRKVLFR